MSIDTTVRQAAARDAEAAWARHRKQCPICGRRGRGPRQGCAEGRGLAADAARLRGQAREAAAADKAPGPNDVSLFELEPDSWQELLECSHFTVIRPQGTPAKRGDYITCPDCGAQRRVIRVFAGQGAAQ